MPVLQYFKWVGSFLLAALLVANRFVPADCFRLVF